MLDLEALDRRAVRDDAFEQGAQGDDRRSGMSRGGRRRRPARGGAVGQLADVGRVVAQPSVSAANLADPLWWSLTALCGAVEVIAYFVIWRKGTLPRGRVRHIPSVLVFGALWGISEALIPYLRTVMSGSEAWDLDATIRPAIEIREGVVRNPKILSFQDRSADHPHPRL